MLSSRRSRDIRWAGHHQVNGALPTNVREVNSRLSKYPRIAEHYPTALNPCKTFSYSEQVMRFFQEELENANLRYIEGESTVSDTDEAQPDFLCQGMRKRNTEQPLKGWR